MISQLQQNVFKSIATIQAPSDPMRKEMRRTPVLPSPPLLREIASHLIYSQHSSAEGLRVHYPLDLRSKTFPRHLERGGLTAVTRNALSLPIDAVYKFIEGFECRTVVSIRLSERTKRPGGVSVRSYVTRSLFTLSEALGRIPTLRELIDILDPSLRDVLDQFAAVGLEHPFLLDVFELLFTAEDVHLGPFDERLIALSERYQRFQDGDLVMKLKLYVERADYRAYYVDKFASRHLAGVIIQKVLLGVTMKERESQELNSWIPAFSSNILNWKDEFTLEEDVYLCKGDISSFTNSSVNTWVVVLLLLVALLTNERVKQLTVPFAVRLSNSYLEVDLITALFIYAYLTIGIRALDAAGHPFIIIGGALGVSGNIVLAKVAFAIEMDEITQKFAVQAPTFRIIRKSLSGDDFAFLYAVASCDRAFVEYSLRGVITKYVGRPKELVIEPIAKWSGSAFSEIPFCKKQILITVTVEDGSYSLHVLSMPKLPFMSQLITRSTKYRRTPAASIATFRQNIRGALRNHVDAEDLEEGYTAAFIAVHDLPGIWHHRTTHYVVAESAIIRDKFVNYTDAAEARALEEPDIHLSDGFKVRPGLVERLRGLRACGAISTTKVQVDFDGGPVVELFHLPAELRTFSRYYTLRQVGPASISASGDQLVALFRTAREQLQV